MVPLAVDTAIWREGLYRALLHGRSASSVKDFHRTPASFLDVLDAEWADRNLDVVGTTATGDEVQAGTRRIRDTAISCR